MCLAGSLGGFSESLSVACSGHQRLGLESGTVVPALQEVLTVRREEGVRRREVVTPGSLAWRGHGARMWAVIPTLTLGRRRDFVSKRLATRLAF